MSLILFGFKGCGKSTWGKRLAERVGASFIDTDREIEKLSANLPYREIYRELGAAAFRLLEKKAISLLSGPTPAIIAVGGGAVIDPENRTALANLGQMVYLKADRNLLKEKIFAEELPAFLTPSNFDQVYEARAAIYEMIPAIPLDAHAPTLLTQLETLWRATLLASSSK